MLIKDGAIQFEPRENAIIFKKFYSVLAIDLVKGLPIAPNKCCSSTTEDYCADIFNKKSNFSYSTHPKIFKKILSCFKAKETASMDQIPAEALKEAANVLAYPLAKIINLSQTTV